MNKGIRLVNMAFLVLSVVGAACYDRWGGLGLKALNAAVFTVLGMINGVYVMCKKCGRPLEMMLALAFCMAADIVLWHSFVAGAMLFAVGHLFYFAGFCRMEKLRRSDLAPGAALFVPVLAMLLFWRRLRFGGTVMQGVCIGYALIISLMFGKALSNLIRKKCRAYALIVLGSALFVVSDIMLLLNVFARAPHITDTLCLFTYFPGQCILAHAIYHLTAVKEDV